MNMRFGTVKPDLREPVEAHFGMPSSYVVNGRLEAAPSSQEPREAQSRSGLDHS